MLEIKNDFFLDFLIDIQDGKIETFRFVESLTIWLTGFKMCFCTLPLVLTSLAGSLFFDNSAFNAYSPSNFGL